MKKIYTLFLFFFSLGLMAQVNVGITGNVNGVYINEIHYDNTGTDTGEFVEVAGPAGTDLSAYYITLYNGANGNSYAGRGLTTPLPNPYQLSGIIDNEGSGFGAVSFSIRDIQNGAPDGIALSMMGSTDVQFLSYEGSFAANDGAAGTLLSVDIGVSETDATPVGYSLEYDEAAMSWVVSTNDSPGELQAVVLSNEENAIGEFNLYPNPVTSDILMITSAKNNAKQVTIFDMLGKQVLSKTLVDKTLDVSSLQPGVYIIKITEDKKTATRKLVVE